jgi:hypothetical protein
MDGGECSLVTDQVAVANALARSRATVSGRDLCVHHDSADESGRTDRASRLILQSRLKGTVT